MVLPMLLAVPFLFIAGTVFAYFVVLPPRPQLPARFQQRPVQHRDPASEYYGFFVLTLIGVGLLFQIPVGSSR